jgi:hypothetical protein
MCNTIGNSATDVFFFWGEIYPSLMQENSFSRGAFLSTRHLLFPSHLRDSASRIQRHKMLSGIPSLYNYFIHKYCVKCYDSCSCQSCAVQYICQMSLLDVCTVLHVQTSAKRSVPTCPFRLGGRYPPFLSQNTKKDMFYTWRFVRTPGGVEIWLFLEVIWNRLCSNI